MNSPNALDLWEEAMPRICSLFKFPVDTDFKRCQILIWCRISLDILGTSRLVSPFSFMESFSHTDRVQSDATEEMLCRSIIDLGSIDYLLAKFQPLHCHCQNAFLWSIFDLLGGSVAVSEQWFCNSAKISSMPSLWSTQSPKAKGPSRSYTHWLLWTNGEIRAKGEE